MTHALIKVGTNTKSFTVDMAEHERIMIELGDGTVFKIALRDDEPHAIDVTLVDTSLEGFEVVVKPVVGNVIRVRAQ